MNMVKSNSHYQISQKLTLMLITLGLALVTMNLLLVRQNESLKAASGDRDLSLVVKTGKELLPIEGIDIDGNAVRFDYQQDHRRTLLLVFSPGCYACEKNMDNWISMISRLDHERFRVVAVSLKPEGTKEYVARYGLSGLPVISEIDAKMRIAYSLSVTPQTMLISADGKAEKVWAGLLHAEEKEEIEQSMNERTTLLSE